MSLTMLVKTSIKTKYASALIAGTAIASIVSFGSASATELPTTELSDAAHITEEVPDLLTERLVAAPPLPPASPTEVGTATLPSTITAHTDTTHTEKTDANNNTIYTALLADTESITITEDIPSQETILPASAQISSAQISSSQQPLTISQTANQLDPIQTEPIQTTPIQTTPVQADLNQVHIAQIHSESINIAQTESASQPPKFGQAGTQRWYLQAGAAADFDDDSFLLGGAGISHFFYDGHSANLELNGLSFSQPGDDAVGATLTFLLRSHWVRGENWSLYVDGGAGIIFTTDKVPAAGSSFNFTPQVGGGASFAINDTQRLMTGIRWYHISNADTFENNPGLDAVFGYVGINFPL